MRWSWALLIGCVAVVLVAADASARRNQALPRATVDRPDDLAGPQVHAFYVVPAGNDDRALDTDGTISSSVGNFEHWLQTQTGGRQLRVDTFQGKLDVTFVRTAETDAQLAQQGAFVRDAIERELIARGLTKPGKIYAVYYDGHSTFACGGGAWPPVLPGIVGALYLRATYGAGFTCYDPSLSKSATQIMDLAILHELLHTLGFVAACAPHHVLAGHVGDSPTDLMYAGPLAWQPSVLDVGHDDYFDAHVAGCPDLATSPYLVSAGPSSYALSVQVVKQGGSGTVSTAPPGPISCPPTCTAQFAPNQAVQLLARPRAGSRFVRWGGDCAGAGTRRACALTLTGDKAVTATFVKALEKCKRGQGSRRKHRCRRS